MTSKYENNKTEQPKYTITLSSDDPKEAIKNSPSVSKEFKEESTGIMRSTFGAK